MVGCFAAMFGIAALSVGPGIVAMNAAAIQASNCETLPQHRRRTTTMTARRADTNRALEAVSIAAATRRALTRGHQ